MDKNFLLSNVTARTLYKTAKKWPIVDYHCHLSPKEIYEDKPFTNIGEMWLGGDHYKWRLMRSVGIDEYYITGGANWHEKFIKYAGALEFAAGHPLYHWSHMELSLAFGIDDYLNPDTAEKIWEKANSYILKNQLSPRKLISKFNVSALCTTDDIVDDLEYHELLAEDKSFKTRVLPSFRTDNLLLMLREDYSDYLEKLASVSKTQICDLPSLKFAVGKRLDYFVSHGCKLSDIGMPYFPDKVYDDDKAAEVFKDLLDGKSIEMPDYLGLVGNMYVFLGKLYKERQMTMQVHLNVIRNPNSQLFATVGADCGADSVGDNTSGNQLAVILDALNCADALPNTIVYTLNEYSASQIGSIIGAFRNVHLGAAWWFCDHKRGIREQIEVISETSCLGEFYGMLTDSRSFLSYPRHDYFRRILCSFLGELCESNEFDPDKLNELAQKICYLNAENMLR